MGRVLMRVLGEAGLLDVTERALSGLGVSDADLSRLRAADMLLVAGLADLVRAKFHGDEVRVFTSVTLRDPSVAVVTRAQLGDAKTGGEALHELALLRLQVPAERKLAVSFDDFGLELAQTALVFGVDTLFGELGGKRTLPLLDGPEARRAEIAGLVQRSGRSVRFVEETARAATEQRT
jgi:hypothetical protein